MLPFFYKMLAISHGARYWETSAKTGQNVDECLEGLAVSVLAKERGGWDREEFQGGNQEVKGVRMRGSRSVGAR